MGGRLLGILVAVAAIIGRSVSTPPAASASPFSQQQAQLPAINSRRYVDVALRAVEGDSVAKVSEKWLQDASDVDSPRNRTIGGRNETTPLGADLGRPDARLAQLGLATLARFTYDYTEATRRYQTLLATRPQPDEVSVYALLGLAWQADTRGLIPQADSLFGQARDAARALNLPSAEAEALLGSSIERAQFVGIPVGLAMLDLAAALIPPGDALLQSELHTRRAVLEAASGKPGAADDALKGQSFARQANAPRAEARALRALALDLKIRGKEDSATIVLSTVASIQRNAKDHSALAETLLRQADALYIRGDLGRFKRLTTEAAVEARRSHNTIAQRSILLGLGALSLLVHDYAAADVFLQRALERCKADGDTAVMMMVMSQRVNLYNAIGATERARRDARAVATYHHAVGDAAEEFSDLRDLIAINLRANNVDAAYWTVYEADALTRRTKNQAWRDRLQEDRGAVLMARGEFARASRAFQRALHSLDTTQQVARYSIRARLAESYARQRDYSAATKELAAADSNLDAWRAMLTDRDLRKMAFQTSARPQNNRDASVASTIALLAANGFEHDALRLAERRRARELTDHIVRAAALAEDNVSGAKRSGSSAIVSTRADATPWMSILGDEHTAVIEYVTGVLDAPTTAFIVTRGQLNQPDIRVVTLPSAGSLAPLIGRFNAMLESGNDARNPGRELGSTLLDKLLDQLGERRAQITRLIIVPDGPLHNLPFDALRLKDGRYAVEHFSVTLAPSGNTVAALRSRSTTKSSSARLLALGNPTRAELLTTSRGESESDANDGDEVDLEPFRFTVQSSLPDLPGAAREAKLVARYAPEADVRIGDDASAELIKKGALSEYDVLHFATHALVDERSDVRTALALAPSEGESGFVFPGDVAALALNADLVVLSACRTAGGVVVDGEGVQGLTSSFLEAGARSVVATQWRIGDEATVALVSALYSGLAHKLPVSEALRQAKLDAIRRGASPREWAALTVVGDPLVQVALREPPPSDSWPMWAAFAGGVAVLGAGGWQSLVRRKSRRAA